MVPVWLHVVATVLWLLLAGATIVPILDLFGGRTGAEGKAQATRRHRLLGGAFVALYLLLCASMVGRFLERPASSPFAALHGLLALGLLPLLVLKVGLVRRWTTLNRFLPSLGMAVFAIAVVVALSGLLMAAANQVGSAAPERASRLEGAPLVSEGRQLVTQACSRCHGVDRVYAHSGRKTRAEWTDTFGRMVARAPELERSRRPILAFLHAELASDPQAPGPGAADPGTPPSPPPPADDRGRGRGRGGR